MSKKGNKNRGNGIPMEVRDFATMTLKKYKKENGDYFDSKKELKKDYFASMSYDLPAVIDWVLRNGHIQNQEVQEIKNGCYQKLAGEEGPAFIKYLTKYVDDYGLEMPNIEFLPIILHEIIGDIIKYNEEHKEQPDEQIAPPDDLFGLAEKILKKRLKKAKKKGFQENLAFDLLCILPSKEATQYAAFFRTRAVFDTLYNYATTIPTLNFGAIIEFLYAETDYRFVIGYALQERKEKYKNFNENQKKLFNDINEWIFNELEKLEKDDIQDILENYIKVRKRDASQGKDGNRRYYVSALPSSIYPKICKVVERIKNSDAEAEKYL